MTKLIVCLSAKNAQLLTAVPTMLRKHGWFQDRLANRHIRYDPDFSDNIWVVRSIDTNFHCFFDY